MRVIRNCACMAGAAPERFYRTTGSDFAKAAISIRRRPRGAFHVTRSPQRRPSTAREMGLVTASWQFSASSSSGRTTVSLSKSSESTVETSVTWSYKQIRSKVSSSFRATAHAQSNRDNGVLSDGRRCPERTNARSLAASGALKSNGGYKEISGGAASAKCRNRGCKHAV